MAEKESVSISINKGIKGDIDSILETRKNEDGKSISRSQYIESLIEEAVKKDKAIQEHIGKNNDVWKLEQQLAAKKKEVRADAEKLIEAGHLKRAISKVSE